MNDKYKIGFFILLGILIGAILTLSIITIIDNTKVKSNNSNTEIKKDKNSTKTSKKYIEEKNNETDKSIKNENNNNEEIIEANNNDTKKRDQIVNNSDTSSQVTSNSNNTININKTTEQTKSSTDSEVLNYLEEKKNEISTKIKDGTYKEKAKNTFIEVVDFLFYNGTIKGHTFNELTSKGKLESIKIAIKIEDKIEEHYPGAIDSIGGKYKNTKSKIVDLYSSKIDEYCSSNFNLCNEAKNDYNKMKSTFKNAFGNIKTKISNFYQDNIKNSN